MNTREPSTHRRGRWAAIGAAIAVTLGAGGLGISHAASSTPENAVFTPITPCRMLDTRPAFEPNDHTTPLGPNAVHLIDVSSSVGDCPAFASATALSLNVTAVNPSKATYLSLVPGLLTPPAAGVYADSSNLNPAPGQPPTPNAVNVDVDSQHTFSVYNAYGSVDVVIDVVGYYADHHHDDRYYTNSETYLRSETYSAAETESALATKANAGASYLKSETYTRSEIEQLLGEPWDRTILVRSGGGAVAAGERLNDALDSIVGTDSYHIVLEPGEYEIAPRSLFNVRISGAGHHATTLLMSGPFTIDQTTVAFTDLAIESTGAAIDADNVEIELDRVSIDGAGSEPLVSINRGLTVRVTDSLVVHRVPAGPQTPVIELSDSDLELNDSMIRGIGNDADGFHLTASGLTVDGGEVRVDRTAVVGFGAANDLEVNAARLEGTGGALGIAAPGNSITVTNSVLDGSISTLSDVFVLSSTWIDAGAIGSVFCRGVATTTGFHDTTCP